MIYGSFVCANGQGMDQSSFKRWELSALDQFGAQQLELALGSPSSESYTSLPSCHPPNEIVTAAWHSDLHDGAAATAKMKAEMKDVLVLDGSKRKWDIMIRHGTKRPSMGNSSASHNQEHVMAERKRREKLTQRFIALSAVVPGLKKVHMIHVDSSFPSDVVDSVTFVEDGQGFCSWRCHQVPEATTREGQEPGGSSCQEECRVSGACEEIIRRAPTLWVAPGGDRSESVAKEHPN